MPDIYGMLRVQRLSRHRFCRDKDKSLWVTIRTTRCHATTMQKAAPKTWACQGFKIVAPQSSGEAASMVQGKAPEAPPLQQMSLSCLCVLQ